jgi:NTE family protein
MMPYLAAFSPAACTTGHGSEGAADVPSTFAVMAVSHGVEPLDLARAVAKALGPQALVLDAWPEGADEDTFHAIEQSMRHVVYLARDPQEPWGGLCLRRADHVVLVAAAGAPPLARDLARLCGGSTWTRQDLVVVQRGQAVTARPAAPASRRCRSTGCACMPAPDTTRTSRGSPDRHRTRARRGPLGRRRPGLRPARRAAALEEVGRPVDLVGGTSIGAIIGAGVAMGWSVAEASERVVDAFVKDSPLNDYTVPFVALTRGAKVESRLARHFGETRIEDLWLPFFCLSTNLSTAQAVVHRTGRLATALRASIAIPGLLPPVATQDGVLVDGAMMNNVPADVMADLERGPVLAIDVAGDVAFQKPDARGWRMRLLRRWPAFRPRPRGSRSFCCDPRPSRATRNRRSPAPGPGL